LGIGPNPQSPIPNPQSPIPNPQKLYFISEINFKIFYFYFYLYYNLKIMRIFQFIIISCLTLYVISDGESKDECTNIKIGLAMPGYQGKDKCIYFIDQVKKNDKSVNLTMYNFI
jgi:hypothetical protein